MKKKVLVVCKTIDDFVPKLNSAGFDCHYKPNWKRQDVLENIALFEGVIFRSKFRLDQEMLDAAQRLQFAGRIGSGLENVDIDYAKKRGVNVYRSPEGNCDAVAEHAIGMLLALLNKINLGQRMVRSFNWDREGARGVRLEDKTIGLIGYGHVGKAMFKRLRCFGVHVLANDKFLSEDPILVELDEIFRKADIISFHIPLTTDTKHYLNKDFISRMNKDFYVINTSRGGVINTEDLLIGLENGRIKGACLDVFEDENINSLSKTNREWMQRLSSNKDVILSPHVAGWNQYSKRALHDILFKKIVEHELGNYLT